MCTYKNEKLTFKDEVNLHNGEYIMVCNGNNDFSLYEKAEYDKVIAIIRSLNANEARTVMRYILFKSEKIGINNQTLEFPERFGPFVFAEKFDVVQKKTHIRVLGQVEDYECYDDKDLAEKIKENIWKRDN